MTSSPFPTQRSIDPADWATLCQSELAALAVDREFAEGLAVAAEFWNAASAGSASHDAAGRTRADAPPGTASGGAAPDDGRDAAGNDTAGELGELRRRVAELERKPTS